ncbi:hypothetical protein AAFC00_005902 [Neodothiora populina]|uniref:non-specific serine/threonine protein kinase n=1 Tax=Neodothiora populina TaxID=2781224 RepID=A0ABR3P6I5_9PEZI
MSHSSADEGEVMDYGSEKATKTRPFARDTAVDRKSRPRSPLSSSPRSVNLQLDGTSDALDYGPDHDQPRNRSHRPQPSHGQKRRYEADSHHSRHDDDHRRPQVRYEPDDESRDRRRNDRSGWDAHGRSARSGRHDDRGPPGKRHQSERHRTRSRSPHRHRVQGEYPHRERASDYASESRHSSARASAIASHGHGAAEQNATPSKQAEDIEVEPTIVDEAQLIEERRKRREALRAKHRAQGTPLLQQALESSAASQSGTPQAATARDSETSDAASMNTSTSTSLPGSPISIASPSATISLSKDEDLMRPGQPSPTTQSAADESFAADYDPNMDMQDVRAREQRATREAGTADSNGLDNTQHAADQPAAPEPRSATRALKEFDMFADDDEDDDMFGPGPEAGHKKEDGTQAVRIPEAKQLDRSLLDDWDDPEGYYRIILGELLDGRYHVQTNLGKGVFSAVVRAHDTKTDRLVAIKVIRKQESMYKAGMKEIETLQTLAEADPEDKRHLIRLERHFEHKGHLCMVFENLSINLREVLKKFGRDVGINIKAVRSYAQQMFLGLSLLRRCEILHADLKPDNVLVNENRSRLKIADLGSAVSASDNEVTDVLVSRFYRAPEIILGIRHDYAIDMWSIGCTLFELYTGKICFTGPTNNQMLRAMMECRGRIPNRMLKKAEFWAQHFTRDGTFMSHEIDTVTRKEVVRPQSIIRPTPSKELKSRLFSNAKGLSPADAKELDLFADLLDKCLAIDPAKRITPNDALKHGFIMRPVPQGPQGR